MLTLLNLILAISIGSAMDMHADHHDHLTPGGRKGLHGMVLFGEGTYYLSHIPMESAPHDFQIVTEVELKTEGDEDVTQSFAQSTFTLKPEKTFSLNDYINLKDSAKVFRGSVHNGSFEMGAPLVAGLENVTVVVKTHKLARQIPNASAKSVFQVTDNENIYELNVITPAANVQKIDNLTLKNELWCVKGPDFFNPCN